MVSTLCAFDQTDIPFAVGGAATAASLLTLLQVLFMAVPLHLVKFPGRTKRGVGDNGIWMFIIFTSLPSFVLLAVGCASLHGSLGELADYCKWSNQTGQVFSVLQLQNITCEATNCSCGLTATALPQCQSLGYNASCQPAGYCCFANPYPIENFCSIPGNGTCINDCLPTYTSTSVQQTPDFPDFRQEVVSRGMDAYFQYLTEYPLKPMAHTIYVNPRENTSSTSPPAAVFVWDPDFDKNKAPNTWTVFCMFLSIACIVAAVGIASGISTIVTWTKAACDQSKLFQQQEKQHQERIVDIA